MLSAPMWACTQTWIHSVAQSLDCPVSAWQAAWGFFSYVLSAQQPKAGWKSLMSWQSSHNNSILVQTPVLPPSCTESLLPSLYFTTFGTCLSLPNWFPNEMRLESYFRLSFCQSGQGYEVLICFMKISHQVKERVLLMNLSSWLASRACSQIRDAANALMAGKDLGGSPRYKSLGIRLPSAIAHESHIWPSPIRLTTQLTLYCQGTPLTLGSEEGRSSFSTQVAPRSQRRSSPSAIPTLSFQDTCAFPLCQEVPYHSPVTQPPSCPTCICFSICFRALL